MFLMISEAIDANQKNLKEKDLIIETSLSEIHNLKSEIALLKTDRMHASTQEIQ